MDSELQVEATLLTEAIAAVYALIHDNTKKAEAIRFISSSDGSQRAEIQSMEDRLRNVETQLAEPATGGLRVMIVDPPKARRIR
jgi:hypothetical protein